MPVYLATHFSFRFHILLEKESVNEKISTTLLASDYCQNLLRRNLRGHFPALVFFFTCKTRIKYQQTLLNIIINAFNPNSPYSTSKRPGGHYLILMSNPRNHTEVREWGKMEKKTETMTGRTL